MTALQQWREPRPILLTVDDFAHLHEAGAFVDYPKAELIEGIIVSMSPQHVRHSWAKTELGFRLRDAVGRQGLGLTTLIEVTIALSSTSAPEPDIVLTNDPAEAGFVQGRSVCLVVEVADSTAAHDLGPKSRLYAEAAIAEYWVLDLPAGRLHQFAGARSDGSWKERCETILGDPITALTIPGLTIDTAGLA